MLAGRVGAKHQVQTTVQAADWLTPMQTLRMRLAAPPGWAGHAPGQFAFVSFSRAEGAHPYTIASAWDGQRHEITFLVKALGDYTSRLHEWLRPDRAYIRSLQQLSTKKTNPLFSQSQTP